MKRVLVVLAVGLAFGCASGKGAAKSDVKGSTAAEYYPLKVGNSWTYDVKLLGQKAAKTVTLVKQEESWFVDSDDPPQRLAADAYGVRDDKRYLLREPVQVGTTWTNVVSVEAVEHYKILSTGSPCQVVAGKFSDCVVVESRLRVPQGQGMLINELTFARGVGLVRIATTLETNGNRVPQASLELTGYTLGK